MRDQSWLADINRKSDVYLRTIKDNFRIGSHPRRAYLMVHPLRRRTAFAIAGTEEANVDTAPENPPSQRQFPKLRPEKPSRRFGTLHHSPASIACNWSTD